MNPGSLDATRCVAIVFLADRKRRKKRENEILRRMSERTSERSVSQADQNGGTVYCWRGVARVGVGELLVCRAGKRPTSSIKREKTRDPRRETRRCATRLG
jgi:hypothetical protein